jgi:hypothetical protein
LDGGEDTGTADIGAIEGEASADDGGGVTPCERALLSHDPLGCNYDLFGFLEGSANPSYACQALLISNPTPVDASLTLTYKGLTLDLSSATRVVTQQGIPFTFGPVSNGVLPAGQSAVVALIQGGTSSVPQPTEYCPFTAAENLSSFVVPAGTIGTAMNLASTMPIYVSFVGGYGVDPNWIDDNVSAASVRSIESWSTRYRDVGVYMPGMPAVLPTKGIPLAPAFMSIVSETNGTVKIATDASTQTMTTSLNEVISLARNDDNIGDIVQSTEPIGLWSRTVNLFVPYDASDANYAAHGVPDTSAWSSEYAVVAYPPRYDTVPDPPVVRIIADADGTILSYDPSAPSGAPASLNAGAFTVFNGTAPFVVRSQDAAHPFYVDMLMTNATHIYQAPDGGGTASFDVRGNPAIVSPLALRDYAQHVVFLTAPDFPDTWLVLTRYRGASGFVDVNVDCAGVVQGWQPIDSIDTYEFAYVALSRGDFQTQTYQSGTCGLGPHAVDSAGFFNVVVWAWGSAATATDAAFGTVADAYALTPFGYPSMRAIEADDAGVAQ